MESFWFCTPKVIARAKTMAAEMAAPIIVIVVNFMMLCKAFTYYRTNPKNLRKQDIELACHHFLAKHLSDLIVKLLFWL